ncbi:glycosyltransferase [Candidatus Gracilibacteria bacterium]|nr:glycosyltransferase [Candidatus Gracilibacteria bacterium]
MTKKILIIGGGTGGHIFPLRNLADELIHQGAMVEMVVADQELDRKIIQENFSNIHTHFFRTGKIRRYISFQNILDVFRIVGSFWTAKKLLKSINPDVLFFKGGFVGFPFLVASKFLMKFHGKIYTHESDISAGILTKLAKRFADESFESFSETSPMPLFYSPKITNGKLKIENRSFTHPSPTLLKSTQNQSGSRKKILLFGGSQGSEFLNDAFFQKKEELLSRYHVTLITGIGKALAFKHEQFKQYEFLPVEKLSQEILESDLVIARGGANSLFEIIAAHKPSIIIPLPSVARNHQMLNAQFFEKKNLCRILEQKKENISILPRKITETLKDTSLFQSLQRSDIKNSAATIAQKMLSSS